LADKILIVDDDENFLKSLSLPLGADFDIHTERDGEDALACFKKYGPFAVVITDMQMAGMSGVDLLKQITELAPETVRVLLTGYSDIDTAMRGINEGRIFRYLTKPCTPATIKDLISDALDEFAIAANRLRLEEELRTLAFVDDLTGINNRRHFFEIGQEEFGRAQRFRRPLAAIMLDIDHFKAVNDTHGHSVGDQVIQEVANRMGVALRRADIIGRYGGEEFSALLLETGIATATSVATRLRESISDKPFQTIAGELRVTVSIGLAAIGTNDTSFSALLNCADEALYRAKKLGRNRLEVGKETTPAK